MLVFHAIRLGNLWLAGLRRSLSPDSPIVTSDVQTAVAMHIEQGGELVKLVELTNDEINLIGHIRSGHSIQVEASDDVAHQRHQLAMAISTSADIHGRVSILTNENSD